MPIHGNASTVVGTYHPQGNIGVMSLLLMHFADAKVLELLRSYLALISIKRTYSSTMTDILDLNCWILGDEPERVFTVKIASSETVSTLKDAIKEKKHRLRGIDADSLDLWKVSY